MKDGWGLTTDETSLIVTDSGSHLYWIDPDAFRLVQELTVRDGDREVNEVNEVHRESEQDTNLVLVGVDRLEGVGQCMDERLHRDHRTD